MLDDQQRRLALEVIAGRKTSEEVASAADISARQVRRWVVSLMDGEGIGWFTLKALPLVERERLAARLGGQSEH